MAAMQQIFAWLKRRVVCTARKYPGSKVCQETNVCLVHSCDAIHCHCPPLTVEEVHEYLRRKDQ